jgi:hypothetical protein
LAFTVQEELSMSDDSMKASSDLIRWLKMLALPTWAKSLLAMVMPLTLFSASGMLVLGDGGSRKLTELTKPGLFCQGAFERRLTTWLEAS